jgi:hypothetical protein|tara:strand:- start:347 stop:568 length:222 start_codon:yes stop_codon:yes gene_type:complete
LFEPKDLNQPDLSQAEEYLCERCEHPFFQVVTMVKKVSPFASPSGQAMFVQQTVFKCDECRWINRSQFGLEDD